MFPLFLAMLGCADDPAECADGFTAGDDGLCYEDGAAAVGDDDDDEPPPIDTAEPSNVEPPTLDDVLAALPPCEEDGGDGRIDLQARCAGDVCAGMSAEEMIAILGEPDSSSPFSYSFFGYDYNAVICDWDAGFSAQFEDADLDGAPDPADIPYSFEIVGPFSGATTDGHRLGSETSCFLEDGQPDYLSFDLGEDGWMIRSMSFDAFSVSDDYDKDGNYVSDGRIDGISLYVEY